jgi:site-specific DNA-methyltransferase (adenine-specific)
MMENTLYYGDNLDVLRRYIRDDSVDLVYLDPPFNSNVSYNVLFSEQDGSRSAAQIRAFEDTWQWDQAAANNYQQIVEAGVEASQAMQAFRTLLGPSNMLAYLAMMAPRLMELRRVLRSSGSIYLHCDPTASHYLKILMDAIFGPICFRSEVIWRRSNAHNKVTTQYGPIHDTILFYSKSASFYFEPGIRPPMRGYIKQWFTGHDERGPYRTNMLTGSGTRTGTSGLPWRGFDPTSVGRHWAIPRSIRSELPPEATSWTTQQMLDYLYERGLIYIPRQGEGQPKYKQYIGSGVPYQDIWAYQPYTQGSLYGTEEAIDEDVRWLGHDGERLPYPTQKPEGLLERIIQSSCPPDGTVLDPFCGCGTTIAAAQRLGRPWIGIDITHLAVTLMKHRLRDAFGPGVQYSVVGEPPTVQDAEQLARDDPYQFQWWALGLVDARPIEGKKGADQGIDGRLYFHDEGPSGTTKQIVLSVKAGKNLTVSMVRELGHVVQRERAQIGVLISMKEPTQPMRAEAASGGFYHSPWTGRDYPRLQLRTVAELLDGNGIDYPAIGGGNRTFRRAKRVEEQIATTPELPWE